MVHKKIRIPRESANEILLALGSLHDAVEFEDLTKNDLEAKKNFSDIIKRCDECRKKIEDFIHISFDFHIPFYNYSTFNEFKNDLEKDIKDRDKIFGSTYFDLLENEINENDRKINELVDSHSQIRDDLVALIEKKHVLLKASELIRDSIAYGDFSESEAGEDGIKQSTTSNLNFMTGVINSEYELKMKRMIFRISRGHAITTFYNLDINSDEYLLTSSVRQRGFSFRGEEKDKRELPQLSSIIKSKEFDKFNTNKKIFTIIFTGGEGNILLQKILKACEIFQASRYPVPKTSEVKEEIDNITLDIKDKKDLIISLEKNLNDLILLNNKLNDKKGYKYSLYRLYFEQQKMIYTTLNKCIVRDTFIDGQIWIPKISLQEVENLLKNIFANKENKLNAHMEDIDIDEEVQSPPTYIRTNEFTSVFQLIVDTYGIPHYREINPGYFTIVTFPFLFGVMFGDIGHGLVVFILGLILCLNNKDLSKTILKPILVARYFVLLLGFFSVFCGLLYNDFLSIPIYFKSCYPKKGKENDHLNKIENCSYKFGIDPVWYISSNELMFINSFKMKLSVILGVSHMTLGILLKGLNAIFEKNIIEFIFIFIPQIALMLALFGYMDLLIFIKWNIDYKDIEFRAPDIKSFLMSIFLKFGKLPSTGYKEDWKFYTDRESLENIHFKILIVSLLCIILMLFPKMILSFFIAKKKYQKKYINNNIGNIGINIEEEGANNEEKMNININERFIDDEPINENENDNNDQKKINNENINIKGNVNNGNNNIIDNEEPKFSDFMVASIIESIEFVLGTVSNTASYLRLWALSLAHSQLSVVFFSKVLGLAGTFSGSALLNGVLLSIAYCFFALLTIAVLLFMDLMECALHTLRLHWIEFQDKFYKADGYTFQPFCFSQSINLKIEEFKQD